MILPIITLLVGVAVVGVSFFILDSHDFKEEDEIYNESSEELKRKITELCDSLLEQSKTSLDEYRSSEMIWDIGTMMSRISEF